MINKKVVCYFCGNTSEYFGLNSDGTNSYSCYLCGNYAINEEVVHNCFDKHKAACYLYHNRVFDDGAFIRLQPSKQRIALENKQVITELDIENWYPKTFQEVVDIILLTVAKNNKGLGSKIPFEEDEFLALIFWDGDKPQRTHESSEFTFLKEYFEDSKQLSIQAVNYGFDFQILPKGYERIYELQKNNTTNKKAFIACKFTETGVSNPILDAIKTAVHECGYIPNAICDKPHNNWIMSEILYEIKDSKFVIADLTGYRAGVYYEAGYGEALGKQVILTCQDGEEFDKVHFDLKQKFIINWTNETDLTDKLKAQIKGTVGIV